MKAIYIQPTAEVVNVAVESPLLDATQTINTDPATEPANAKGLLDFGDNSDYTDVNVTTRRFNPWN